MLFDKKNAQVHAFLIAIIFIVIFLFVFVVVMPIAAPSIEIFNASPDNNAFDKFLFAALPFMVVIGGVIMAIRGQ